MAAGTQAEFTRFRRMAGLGVDDFAALREKAQTRTSSEETSFTFVDLFAGIGSLRIGFEGIGGICVFTSEWDRFARETYLRNFPESPDHVMGGDIREFTDTPESLNRIPAHDVLLAGFPCDKERSFVFDLFHVIEKHKPAVILISKTFVSKDDIDNRTFRTVVDVLKGELGYQTNCKVIESEPWVPQKGKHLFMVGFRGRVSFNFDELVIPKLCKPVLGSILESDPDPKYTLSHKLWNYLQSRRKKQRKYEYNVYGANDVASALPVRYDMNSLDILINRGRGQPPRRLTPRECARLMGFEREGRDWKIPVPDNHAYRQFGKAVIVPVAESVAQLMRPYIEMSARE